MTLVNTHRLAAYYSDSERLNLIIIKSTLWPLWYTRYLSQAEFIPLCLTPKSMPHSLAICRLIINSLVGYLSSLKRYTLKQSTTIILLT